MGPLRDRSRAERGVVGTPSGDRLPGDGRDFPDAIAAGAASAATGAPLLLVPSDGSVPTSVSAELSRLRPTSLTVVGGPAAIGELVVALATGAAS
ncbi:MAG: cell wall-binding repeat-containing protein [Actinobacteria bacterium]|nr:cell wall-binding repeat-containing protein [Actinomycetota bacterium]